MTEPSPQDRRVGPQALFLVIVVIVVVVAGLSKLLNGDGKPQPVASPSPATSQEPSARPDCEPEIVESGAGSGTFGFVYRSACDQVVRALVFKVSGLDAAGGTVAEASIAGGVLFPGDELAAAGTFGDAPVTRIGIEVTGYGAYPASDFTGWTRATVTTLTRGAADDTGATPWSGTLHTDPAGIPACVDRFVLIVRNKTAIVYAATLTTLGATMTRPSFSVPPLTGADVTRSAVYAPQAPRTVEAPAPGISCDGS
jgi:hypothetical protein